MDKKIIIFAVYESDNLLRADNIRSINFLSKSYSCYLIYVGKLENLNLLNNSIKVLHYGHKGYDLNSYKLGLNQLSEDSENKNCKILFFNNSIFIGNYKLFSGLIEKMFSKLDKNDFVAFAENNEITKHFQTFLFGIKLKTKTKVHDVLIRVSKLNKPIDRQSVIDKFELKNFYYLQKYHLESETILKFNTLEFIRLYFNFIIKLGFIDNKAGIFQPRKINYTTFGKFKTLKLFGFKKIKSSTIISKIINFKKDLNLF